MKNNLLKIALSLGMIVAVSGMQDASYTNSSTNEMTENNNINPINFNNIKMDIMPESMNNTNDVIDSNSKNIMKN
ncbi:MAG: hypothetical protein IJU54_00620 [Alphaproteobacteria bacterium]|nr:hypothetical protein [Alphaproteobacteria bacterium]